MSLTYKEELINNMFDEEYIEEMPQKVSDAISNLLTVLSESSNNELIQENKHLNIRVEQLTEDNRALNATIEILQTENENLNKCSELNTLAIRIIHNALKIVKTHSQVEKFLDCLFVPSFENVHLWEHTPLWISALTRYYKDREFVLSLIRYFEWCKTTPKDADKFRLPLDWSEAEIECWLNHMSRNYVCNGKLYTWDNLQWWSPFALKDISTFYNKYRTEYSEVPFQYIFMNPCIKTEKFLIKLGEEISGYHSELIKGIEMLNLEESDRALVIKSSLKRFTENGYPLTEASEDYRRWLWDNIDVIMDRNIIHQLYEKYCNEYTRFNEIIKLPSVHIINYISKYPKRVGEFLSSSQLTNEAKKFIIESLESLYDTENNI